MRKSALETRARRLRACAEDHFIGAGCAYLLGSHGFAQLDLHLQFLQLCMVPVQKPADFTALGLAGGEAELTAKLTRFFDETHAMAAFGRHTRGLETCWAAADDQNRLGLA